MSPDQAALLALLISSLALTFSVWSRWASYRETDESKRSQLHLLLIQAKIFMDQIHFELEDQISLIEKSDRPREYKDELVQSTRILLKELEEGQLDFEVTREEARAVAKTLKGANLEEKLGSVHVRIREIEHISSKVIRSKHSLVSSLQESI